MRVSLALSRFRCLALLLVCCGSIAPANPALPHVRAATMIVTTTADELNHDGDCSLREAIRAANQRIAVDACPAGTGNDLIELPAATYNLSLAGRGDNAGATGDLDIADNLTIRGSGAETTLLDGQQIDRVLDVLPSTRLTLVGITVRNGKALDESGGGMANAGTVTLIESVVAGNIVDNSTTPAAPFPIGGGIYNAGTLTIIESTIRNNTIALEVFLPPDSTVNAGAGIYSSGTLTVIRSTVSENQGMFGSGIYSSGALHLSRSVVSNNHAVGFAGGFGGGIYNRRTGTGTLANSYVTHNTASGRNSGAGGGIVNQGQLLVVHTTISSNGSGGAVDGGGFGGGVWNTGGALLTLVGSTVSGNFADGAIIGNGAGGGIVNEGHLVIRNSTISGNRTEAERNSTAGSTAGGIYNRRGRVELASSTISANIVEHGTNSGASGAGIDNVLGVVALHNTLLAGNMDDAGEPGDCAGEIVSEGYNLIQDTSGCTISGTTTGDLLNVAAGLSPLQNNGGPTMTHALELESPAIDAGSLEECPSTDQRGITRPKDGDGEEFARCDIGAHEREGVITLLPQYYLPLIAQPVR